MRTVQQSWTVGCIGECMIEMQGQTGDISMTFGGDTLNTAVYLARLGPDLGVRVEYITALGEDNFSTAMRDFWRTENVGSSLTRRIPGKLPGLYFIELEPSGERRFSYWRGESAARDCFELPGATALLEGLEHFDALYLSGISLAILHPEGRRLLLDRLQTLRGKELFFDFNYRPRLWGSGADAALAAARPWYREMLNLNATVLLTQDEAQVPLEQAPDAGPDLCRALAALGAREVVVKNGEKDSFALAGGRICSIAPAGVVHVVDTTAAGDSFSAAYLLARHVGMGAQKALAMAHTLAGTVITHKGAIIPRSAMPQLFGAQTE